MPVFTNKTLVCCMQVTGIQPQKFWSPYTRHHGRRLSTTAPRDVSNQSADLQSGFTGSYDPTIESGSGPMFNKAKFGVPQFYPRDLKKRVDEYVVGQERAKRTICSTLFNHYQKLRRWHQHELERRNRQDKVLRQRFARDRELYQKRKELDPVEDGIIERHGSVHPMHGAIKFEDVSFDHLDIPEDPSEPDHVKIDKSNLLLIGPTGVGKTYILETLSKQINVPFTICDCNSLTQAGYIGQDVESCIERLLIESNYDVKATEYGIVVLDEFDKLARRESSTGRDVGGEGVQQSLLKLVEGTKVTISVKENNSSRASPPITTNYNSAGSGSTPQSAPPGGKVDQYTIDTSNILFVFCGAFFGLDKAVLRRVAKPSMGFGGELRGRSSLAGDKQVLPPSLFSYVAHHDAMPISSFTALDIATPADLQTFGFIPELIGRLHNICALNPLSSDDLLKVLTQPRNCLVAQYTALFETYPSRLFFTEKALHAIAERAATSGTGARALKMEMERVLAEPIFDAPLPYVLIHEACVKGSEKPLYWGREGRFEVDRRMQDEAMDRLSPTPQASPRVLRGAGESGE
ncbi:hypothetical protein E4U58_002681 [Claviceps cyperi]|nr:hypothetical protein E4U58_002681 [Claviceps cyperi]